MKLTIFTLAFTLSLALCPVPASAQGPAPVRVDEVITEPMRQTMPVLGRVVARQRGEISAQVAGAVKAVQVDVGDRVEEGDLLAAIDDSWLVLTLALREAELAEAQAAANRDRAGLTMAQQSLDRIQGLSGTSSFSSARFEDAEGEFNRSTASLGAARSRIAYARAELDVAKLSIERAKIRAPYSGIVVARQAQPGAYLNVGSPVVTLIQDTSMEIEADVPVEQSANLEPNLSVRAVRSGGAQIEATVRAVIPEENPLTRTRAVRFVAEFDILGGVVASGESVTVHIPVAAERMVNTVHKDALVQRPSGPTVFIIQDGAAEIRPITIGLAIGERFEVTNGLEAGHIVVVRGNERLRPGQKVSF